jgi:hypothetical protein
MKDCKNDERKRCPAKCIHPEGEPASCSDSELVSDFGPVISTLGVQD